MTKPVKKYKVKRLSHKGGYTASTVVDQDGNEMGGSTYHAQAVRYCKMMNEGSDMGPYLIAKLEENKQQPRP